MKVTPRHTSLMAHADGCDASLVTYTFPHKQVVDRLSSALTFFFNFDIFDKLLRMTHDCLTYFSFILQLLSYLYSIQQCTLCFSKRSKTWLLSPPYLLSYLTTMKRYSFNIYFGRQMAPCPYKPLGRLHYYAHSGAWQGVHDSNETHEIALNVVFLVT